MRLGRAIAALAAGAVITVPLLGAKGCGASSPSGQSSPAAPDNGAVTSAPASSPASHAAVPVRKVEGKAVTLGAGTFKVGTDVAVGLYDVTAGAGQSGNFVVQGTDEYDEILGGSDGVPKVRVRLQDGDSVQISGLSSVTFTPVSTPFVTAHEKVNLYAGTWTVGQDLGAGRYVATPGAGQSGNFVVEAEGVDEILGGSDGVPKVTVDLQSGDVVDISGLASVMMTPTS